MEAVSENQKLEQHKEEFSKVIKDVFEGILETYFKMANDIK